MDPTVWGPSTWLLYHSVPLDYPDNPTTSDKENIKQFYTNIGLVIPCASCKLNYKKHLQKFPLSNDILSSKTKLFNWTVDIHNEVNKLNNKKVLSYPEAYTILISRYKKDNNQKTLRWCLIIALIMLVLVVVYVYKDKQKQE